MRFCSIRYSIGKNVMTLFISSTDQSKAEIMNQAMTSLRKRHNEELQIHFVEYFDAKHPEQNESIHYYQENELRSNQGYRILESQTIGAAEFVVGYNPNAADPYVCWNCMNETFYDFGHYCSTFEEAYQVMLSRCRTEAAFLKRKHGEQEQNHIPTPKKNHEQQL